MDTILAENMKRLREKYNLTQEIVAVSLGVPDLVVYRWEAGREYPDKRMIKKIAEFYEISVNELLENKVEVAPERPTADHLSSLYSRIGRTIFGLRRPNIIGGRTESEK